MLTKSYSLFGWRGSRVEGGRIS